MSWRKLNSERFKWENSVRANGISMHHIFQSKNGCEFKYLQKGIKLIGYCNPEHLPVLPCAEGFAIMMEFPNGEEYWMHNLEKVYESKEVKP